MKIETITSAQNPKVKMLLELQEKSKTRRKEGLFVVEGYRELLHCLSAGYVAHAVFVCSEILSSHGMCELERVVCPGAERCRFFDLPKHLYEKVAYRGSTEGVIAELHCMTHSLEALNLKENPLVIVLESVEKPGNLGAVLRSADAAGADAVIV
jgi:TrmH family RNA methyltransferase